MGRDSLVGLFDLDLLRVCLVLLSDVDESLDVIFSGGVEVAGVVISFPPCVSAYRCLRGSVLLRGGCDVDILVIGVCMDCKKGFRS